MMEKILTMSVYRKNLGDLIPRHMQIFKANEFFCGLRSRQCNAQYFEQYNDKEDNSDDDDQRNQHHYHDHQIFFSIPDPGTIEPLDHKLPKDIGSEGADFTLKCLDKVN